MPLYGYARVSTIDQDLRLQRAALEAAGCYVMEPAVGWALRAGWSKHLGQFDRLHIRLSVEELIQCILEDCLRWISPRK
jgi:DNA invertase Pin-like site-specific DNA recombinase